MQLRGSQVRYSLCYGLINGQEPLPELIIIRPDMEKYRKASELIQKYLTLYYLIEPLSLDEAFLDVSDCSLFEAARPNC